ncbi:MAG TPA: hypothetical protein PKD05_20285, partial [Candidatus Melainabacteria bacterium]|nr:hypothetical protein [Candidatus Melainabacteria bacterium]
VNLPAPNQGLPADTALFGPLCMNIDEVRASIQLPPLKPGDRLLFKSVGAYNNSQWMQFIEYRPNVVLVDRHGEVRIIRKAENLDSMISHDLLPDHLKEPSPSAGDLALRGASK